MLFRSGAVEGTRKDEQSEDGTANCRHLICTRRRAGRHKGSPDKIIDFGWGIRASATGGESLRGKAPPSLVLNGGGSRSRGAKTSERATVLRRSGKRGASERLAFLRREKELFTEARQKD